MSLPHIIFTKTSESLKNIFFLIHEEENCHYTKFPFRSSEKFVLLILKRSTIFNLDNFLPIFLTFPFLTFFIFFTSVAHAFDRVKKKKGQEGKTGGAAEVVGRTALPWALNICYK